MPGLELHCDSTGLVQNVPQHLTQISNLPMDPFNSSTSQISFLWNVISPREKVSVPINPFVWQYYINPFACILDWMQINRFSTYDRIPSNYFSDIHIGK